MPPGKVIQELSTIFIWREEIGDSYEKTNYELILGEVKLSRSQKTQILKQLERYILVHLCDKAYAVLYDERDLLTDHFGLICINDEYLLRVKEAKKPLKVNRQMQKADQIWLTNYAKFYLLANLPFNKIIRFINSRRQASGKVLKSHYRSYDVIESIVMCPLDDFLDFLDGELERKWR